MSEKKVFHKNLQILRNRVKQRRKQELYDMMNEENNSIEDKVALIKMSLSELDSSKLQKSFKSLINNENQSKKE
tara:strand:- start:1481 stop:1702 length:222 start_codon:yes stop_codon:yes gene_type:complete